MKSESVGESVGESSALEGAKEPKSKRGKDSKWKHLLKVLLGKASKMAILMAVIMAGLWALGFAMRIGWIPTAFESDQNASATSENSRYVCPMMCVEPSTVPGRCPVCAMELVPASPDSGGDSTSIFVAPVARRLIGVRTAEAKLRVAKRTIRTIGSIQYDESQLSTISAYVDGRLEKLYANYVGVPVKEGDSLALLYSPELYTAQAEYLSSQAGNSASRFVDADSLRTLAREKLFELGMSEEQMKALEEEQEPRSRLRLESPQNGTVIEKLAVEGDYVKTGQTIFRVADLSTVWMMLDLFPEDASRVFFGQEVEAEISSAPGIVFTGRVAFVDPTVNAKTRSVRVRVEILNLDGQLRPGDYASARISISAIPADEVYDPALAGKYISPMHPKVIRDGPGPCPICDMDLIPTTELGYSENPLPEQRVITIPRDAVLIAGQNSVVYVESEPGRFETRRIVIAALTNEYAVVAEGLREGEVVATQGNFLLDSQSQLVGNPSLLDPTKAVRFAPGPLQLEPIQDPHLLEGDSAVLFDAAYQTYFSIQVTLAADERVSPSQADALVNRLNLLLNDGSIPDANQRNLLIARDAAAKLVGSIEQSRRAFRKLSHAMIRAIYQVRGKKTQTELMHYFCSMVPGGGGDWLQPGTELRNPYWGAEMLECGELVVDLALEKIPASTSVSGDSQD